MYKFIIAFFITGCAVGSGPVDPDTFEEPPIERNKFVPSEPEGLESNSAEENCKLIRTIWGGNCKLDAYSCTDGGYRLDSRCYPAAWEFPHQNDPDPPFKQ